MKLSIAFITYNRSEELIRAIESCFPVGIDDYEIVIWDNNSNEKDKTQIETYVDNSEANIKYYYSNSNLGVAGGRNSVWRKCKGEYVYFLDDDAVIKNHNYFPEIIQYMDINEKVTALAVKVYEPATKNYLIPKQKYKGTDGMIRVLCYVGCAFMLRRSDIKKKYLYPEKLLFGSEEYYSSMLIWNNGKEIHYYKDGIVFHMPSSINRYIGKERNINFISNTYLIRLLTYPFWLKPILDFTLALRAKRNQLNFRECRELAMGRYDSREVDRIKIKTLIILIRKFGLKNII